MSKFAFILISILATSVLNLSAEVNVATPSSIRVHHFVVKGKTTPKILRDLAEEYRLVIGVYGIGDTPFSTPTGVLTSLRCFFAGGRGF